MLPPTTSPVRTALPAAQGRDFDTFGERLQRSPCIIHVYCKRCTPASMDGRIIWQSSVAKALPDSLQNFGDISFFLPASDSARAPGVAIGLSPANSSASVADAQQVYGILHNMLDRWNAHDLEGYMEVHWKSPELLVVVDAEQFGSARLVKATGRRKCPPSRQRSCASLCLMNQGWGGSG